MTRDRRIGRWAVGLFAAAVLALLVLWYGFEGNRGGADTVDTAGPAAGGDMIPPVDEGADASLPPPPQPDHTTTDVIPPEEP